MSLFNDLTYKMVIQIKYDHDCSIKNILKYDSVDEICIPLSFLLSMFIITSSSFYKEVIDKDICNLLLEFIYQFEIDSDYSLKISRSLLKNLINISKTKRIPFEMNKIICCKLGEKYNSTAEKNFAIKKIDLDYLGELCDNLKYEK